MRNFPVRKVGNNFEFPCEPVVLPPVLSQEANRLFWQCFWEATLYSSKTRPEQTNVHQRQSNTVSCLCHRGERKFEKRRMSLRVLSRQQRTHPGLLYGICLYCDVTSTCETCFWIIASLRSSEIAIFQCALDTMLSNTRVLSCKKRCLHC